MKNENENKKISLINFCHFSFLISHFNEKKTIECLVVKSPHFVQFPAFPVRPFGMWKKGLVFYFFPTHHSLFSRLQWVYGEFAFFLSSFFRSEVPEMGNGK